MTRAPRTGPIAGVIFDLDGVLVDTEELWERSWMAYCDRHEHRWTPRDTSAVMGMSAPEWSAYLAELLGEGGTAERVRRWCVDHVLEAIRGGEGVLLEGARELVIAVSGQVPIALASSATRSVIDQVLTQHDLAERFGATVSSEEVARGKPHPDVYLEAARRIQVDGKAALAVEDSGNGIRAAHAAGLGVVALPNQLYPPAPDVVELAEYVAADHAQVRDYVLRRLDEAGSMRRTR